MSADQDSAGTAGETEELAPVVKEPGTGTRVPGQLPVTEIPETPDVGKAFGEPILVGGADLLAASATLVSYQSPEGPRTVLHARLDEAAEDKLLDALNISPDMVPTQVEQTVQGKLPLDEHHQLGNAIITAAKSVNFHLNHGDLTADSVPETTQAKISAAQMALAAAANDIGTDPGPVESAMLKHYHQKLAAVENAATTATAVCEVTPFLHEGTATVTRMAPALPPDATGEHTVAVLRAATRIKPALDATTGQASWDGTARWDDASGKEYAIDLGDGFHAVYRPYSINNPATTDYSLRGRLEIIAPAGTGHGPDVVCCLGQLNLANRPMTRDEGEHSYLTANITAQGLSSHSEITAAQTTGDHLEEMIRQELFHERAHQAVGMTDIELARFAKDIQLEAATRALPAKVGVLRDAIAHATGHSDGAALAASPGYDPTPRRSGGWLTWNRFDVGNAQSALGNAVQGRSLVHKASSAGLKAMLANGVLASTERRTMMGVQHGMGQSEEVDKATGGASSVFLRMHSTPVKPAATEGPRLVWDDPERLLARADYYGANADTYGVINPAKMSQYSGHAKPTRDPFTIAAFKNPANEVMFGDGIDLLGLEGPSRILCVSTKQRNDLHAMLTAKGVTHIAGKPLDDVLHA
ncbi:hypothetical protein [Amycolatopsis samaneae]|uniref:Uncharacterized protein n=1 Tax=Amycolatopsis samaneae TaxID=664691 RepID=A0ABW5GXF8_9PSEU